MQTFFQIFFFCAICLQFVKERAAYSISAASQSHFGAIRTRPAQVMREAG